MNDELKWYYERIKQRQREARAEVQKMNNAEPGTYGPYEVSRRYTRLETLNEVLDLLEEA